MADVTRCPRRDKAGWNRYDCGMWWKRKLDLVGAAYFRGSLAPSLQPRALRSNPRRAEIQQQEIGSSSVNAADKRLILQQILATARQPPVANFATCASRA
jgi:hypothetical protein